MNATNIREYQTRQLESAAGRMVDELPARLHEARAVLAALEPTAT